MRLARVFMMVVTSDPDDNYNLHSIVFPSVRLWASFGRTSKAFSTPGRGTQTS